MADQSAISVQQVSKKFGHGKDEFFALENVSVDIRENEFFTLLGPSGCGKTTLLRLIAGFEHPSAGRILLHGEEISHLPPFKRPVNTVFQNYALFPHLTVAENIGFGLTMQDKPEPEVKATVSEMLQLVQMESLRDRRTDQISGGQQQRVALARALAPHPRVLLLDEPLSALDYKLRKGMQIELKRLQLETGITFIFVTHDQEEALTMSDRLAVMNKGKILQVGSPGDIYDRPSERFVADFIGDTNFLTAQLLETSAQGSVVKLSSGKTLSSNATDSGVSQTVHIAVRPEQATLTENLAEADLQGKVTHVRYSGTDSHFHVELDSGEDFVTKVQNSGANRRDWKGGQTVGIKIDPGAAQILID
ncbi:MAG: ABC transporter ATP-binding protein [Gammaproteobacteria bacterium]|nr:ABC transporter ATP-binding protein [Gammaproteobacteria bacterium]MBT8437122.1 ABC transporter ATP-binding protein [Gammaproteobacteria bacterium]